MAIKRFALKPFNGILQKPNVNKIPFAMVLKPLSTYLNFRIQVILVYWLLLYLRHKWHQTPLISSVSSSDVCIMVLYLCLLYLLQHLDGRSCCHYALIMVKTQTKPWIPCFCKKEHKSVPFYQYLHSLLSNSGTFSSYILL